MSSREEWHDDPAMSREERDRLDAIRRELDLEYAEELARDESPPRTSVEEVPRVGQARRAERERVQPRERADDSGARRQVRRPETRRAEPRRSPLARAPSRNRGRIVALLIATFLMGCMIGGALGSALTVLALSPGSGHVPASPSRP
jgi:hypothetical protein